MGRIYFICSLIFFTLSITFPQDDSSNIYLSSSSFALQFQINNSFRINSFQGDNLSVKYQINENSAIRCGVQFHVHSELSNKINDFETGSNSNSSIILQTQFIWYQPSTKDLYLFYGAGPYYEKYISKSACCKSDLWEAGVSGVLGTELFIKKNLSLSAEYGLLLYYSIESRPDFYSNGQLYKRALVITSDNQLRIGLSFYL